MSKLKKQTAQAQAKQVDGLPQLRFRAPGKDAPGYLRRQRQALEFSEKLKQTENISAQTIDDLVAFFLPFVTVPTSRDEAREALFDMSQAQFEDMLNELTGERKGVPPVKSARSANGSMGE